MRRGPTCSYRSELSCLVARVPCCHALAPAPLSLRRPPTPPADESGYSLLNPVPDDKLREFSTDRPGKSHSSTTVDAGRFQIESDFGIHIRSARAGAHDLSFDPRCST